MNINQPVFISSSHGCFAHWNLRMGNLGGQADDFF
jgi:hypothetical protein